MLRLAINVAVFGAFVLMVFVFGFFLWQTLFTTEENGSREAQAKPAYSEQHNSQENALGASASPSASKATDEAIAAYTKWLAVFTMFLVLATLGLFVSGERNVDAARRSAEAARESAVVAKKSIELSDKTAERQLRAYIGVNNMNLAVYPLEGGEFAFIAHIEMRNFGQTPAANMSVWAEAAIDGPDEKPFDFSKELSARLAGR